MKYDMTRPCGDCPFRKEGGVKLAKSRIREIGGMMLARQGGTFPCHKTVDYEDNKSGSIREDSKHCAGALIFAEKHGNATQLMRIAERLGLYDPTVFDQSAKDLVWDSRKEWLEKGSRSTRKGGAA